VLCLFVLPTVAGAAASDPMLFRLFLTDGTSLVSYGEFARVDDRVVFSLASGSVEEPRLQVATLPASSIDWSRTDRHAASTATGIRHTRGKKTFSVSVTALPSLNQVVQTPIAPGTRVARSGPHSLSGRANFGYRRGRARDSLVPDSIIPTCELRPACVRSTWPSSRHHPRRDRTSGHHAVTPTR
jgi:hypothetical protein